KKIFLWLILISFSVALGTFLLIEIYRFTKSIDYSGPTVSELGELIEGKTITLILVGDIMLDRGVEYMVEKKGKGDFRFPFLKIAEELQKADILFGNLEGVISDKGIKIGSIYSFRADPKAIEGLSFAGFNVLSLANNHAFDYTREALEDCLAKLSNAGIGYVGAGFTENEAYSPLIKDYNPPAASSRSSERAPINGTKIAFLAYTNLGPETWRAVGENSGIAWIDEEKLSSIKQEIRETKEKVDILIVSLHAGEEYAQEPTKFQVEFSKMAIDAGADLIVGHHPHVIQPNEKYPSASSGQAGWIFYSLGNFIFDQGFSEKTMRGQILEVIIKDKEIKEIIPKEIKINNFFQPEILE
ncbi:MAG: CapA family protein, partial [Candidatus Pacebacteria bacterium]|nr:CapA family protein [Candidatus Paceibacterota bacterium]